MESVPRRNSGQYSGRVFHDDELEELEKFYVGQPHFLLLLYVLYNTLVPHSKMVWLLSPSTTWSPHP